MTTIDFPFLGRAVSRIALGCMHFGGNRRNDEDGGKAVRKRALLAIESSLEEGIDFFDHADIYARGESERVFGEILKELKVSRSSVVIQTKCGIRFAGDPDSASPARYDFSEEHILRSVDASLQRLQVDQIDVLLLHRPDPLMEPEEVASAFAKLHASGKVRAFGVSNQTPPQMALLRGALPFPLVANQVELNPLKTALIDAGMVSEGREPAPGHPSDGTLEYHRRHGIVTQAWAPLAYGYLSGRKPDSDDPRIEPACEVVREVAKAHQASPESVIIAWILRHPARIQPVIGTRDPERIRACARAADITLSREEWYRLYLSGRGSSLP